jgi:hypothetical protein
VEDLAVVSVGSRGMLALRLFALGAVAFVVLGCPSPAQQGGNIHFHITRTFDDRATEEALWHSGTISADGEFPRSKLDTMDTGAEYAWDLLGPTPWMASTDQAMGDFIGDCNGGQCDPCTAQYSGEWEIGSVQLNMQERGSGRYLFTLWLGSERPPHTGGCDETINSPAYWGERMTITMSGIDSLSPSVTTDAEGVEVRVTKT